MPINVESWIRDVVEHNLKRETLKMERTRPLHSLTKSIASSKARKRPAIIAEYKRKSPSGLSFGISCRDYVRMVRGFVAGLSVLTEELYFGGSYGDLITIASEANVPVLMKDFVVCEKQVETAYSIGADAILLITTILTEEELKRLYERATEMGLEVVVEVHDERDLKKAMALDARIIGINARNLRTLEVSLDKAARLLENIPERFIKIAESGIRSKRDVEKLAKKGADAFLVGTTLMKDPAKIYELVGTS